MTGIELVCDERAIEDVLWEHCSHYLGLARVARQFRTNVGVIDLVARHPNIPHVYFVIEVKRGVLDSQAYTQVLRYCKWMNSERSKEGRRAFFPLLIGERLSTSLDHLCRFFYETEHAGTPTIHSVAYRLFSFHPLSGLRFDFVSMAQRESEAMYREKFCHIEKLSERADVAEWRLDQEQNRE